MKWELNRAHLCAQVREQPHDDSPLDTARREFFEETGYAGTIQIYSGEMLRRGRSACIMFIGVVPTEFVPVLNDENDDSVWIRPEALVTVSHLHWPLCKLLRQRSRPHRIKGRRLVEALFKARRR